MAEFRYVAALSALVLTLAMAPAAHAEEHAPVTAHETGASLDHGTQAASDHGVEPAADHGAEHATDHGAVAGEPHSADIGHAVAPPLVCTEATLAEDAERRAANPIVAQLMLELPNCPQPAATVADATAEAENGQKPAKAAH